MVPICEKRHLKGGFPPLAGRFAPFCLCEQRRYDYNMEENFGTLSDLGIRFQEAVLLACDEAHIDPNFLSEGDWNDLYDTLTEDSLNDLVKKAVETALR